MEVLLESKPRVSFEFEVEKVIGVSSDGNFQVQWAPAWVSKFHLVGCEHLIQEFLKEQSAREMKPEPESLYELCEDITTEMEGNTCERTEEISQPEWNYSPSCETSTNSVEVGVPGTLLKDDTHKNMENPHVAATLLTKGIQDLVTNSTITLSYGDGLLEELVERRPSVADRPSAADTETSSILADEATSARNEIGDKRYCIKAEKEGTDEPEIHYENCLTGLEDWGEESNSHTIISLPPASMVEVSDESNSLEITGTPKAVKPLLVCQDLELLTASKNTTANELGEPHRKGQACYTKRLKTTQNYREKRYSCSICEKRFPKPSRLASHFKIHTGEKSYKCPHCNNSFAQKKHLKQHLNTHTRERPYSCTQCSYTCSRKDNLMVHMRRHTAEKPFACEHCSYSSADKSDLNRHLRRIHTQEKLILSN